MAIGTATALAIAGGAAVVGGGANYLGGRRAAKAQKNSLAAILSQQRSDLDKVLALQEPSRQIGMGALSNLSGLIQGTTLDEEGNVIDISPEERARLQDLFTESPGYQFRFDEGVKALERGASARGDLLGGRQLKDLTRFGQGVANQEYGGFLDRLGSLAGYGQAATQSQVGAYQTALPQQYNTLTQLGNVNAQRAALPYSAISAGLNTGINTLAALQPFGQSQQQSRSSQQYQQAPQQLYPNFA